MTHLGQRLSALIDGELEGSERERALWHITKCDACREEAAALRIVKRRTSALREEAAGAGLIGRLIGLSELASAADRDPADQDTAAERSQRPPWPDRGGELPGRGQASPEQRAARYFIAGSLAIFLAGLGTAAFIAGGEPQPQAPTPPVAPSIDVMVFGHGPGGDLGTVPPIVRPSHRPPRPALSAGHSSRTGA